MKSFQLYLSIESKTPILYVNINFTGSLLLRFGVFPFFWALAPTNNVFLIVSWRSPAANNCRNKRPNGHILIDSPSIRRRNSTWKVRRNYIDFERRIHVEIMTSIRRGNVDVVRLSKSTKYRWVFHVDFSTLFQRRIDVTSALAVSIVSFPNIFCSGNLF